ncbi:MAG: Nif3-like dinuclear metal center hexameric protein [Deferribacteraceae bacterium]|jgi:dinuclear metal center YbgI/SA1388 family protein|nr:Nif3-like dinuclear metal center hexameric protein [Deferribacteraceae bacterium]
MRLKASVDKIANFFEKEFADIRHQSTWDNSGRQVYLGDMPVTKLCLALDPAQSVVNQAIDGGCELLITHHPLFFKAHKGLNNAILQESLAIKAIKNNLNILSYHTNLDMAAAGLSTHIVRLLDACLGDTLEIEGERPYSILSVYVVSQEGYENKLIDALAAAGAGQFGEYSRCAFSSTGIGTFTPSELAIPFIGTAKQVTHVEESRIDMLLPNDKIDAVLKALHANHPYEEPAYYIMPTKSPESYGFGRIGSFKEPMIFNGFVAALKKQLGLSFVNTNMPDYTAPVSKFAVVTGSAASSWPACQRQGIDILITGDMKHHDALDAREAGICIIDAGHFATEKIFMNHLAEILGQRFELDIIIAQESTTINMI